MRASRFPKPPDSVGLRAGRGGGGTGRTRGPGYCLSAALLIATLHAGCANTAESQVGRLSPRILPFLRGVPVPTDFEWVADRSEDDLSGGMRFARHEYAGPAGMNAVRQFYREEMPPLGWDQKADYSAAGRITMRFENKKQNEECTVEIGSGGLFEPRTRIRVIVKPLTGKLTEPPRRPVP